jgi:hypothetical protein
MFEEEFARIARRLEESLHELKHTDSPSLRRSKLRQMRMLLEEADRLARKTGRADPEDEPDTGKR